jgi:hypothetical protein
MQFNAIVGNPPYQEGISDTSENSSLSKQIFPSFIELAVNLNPDYLSLVTPSRWFTGDAQDKSFLKLREFVRENNHFSKIVNYPYAADVFPGIVLKGGVNYFLYEKDYDGKVCFINKEKGGEVVQERNLFEDNLDIILSDQKNYKLINKIKSNNFIPLTSITTGRDAFGIVGKESSLMKIAKKDSFKGSVVIRCKGNQILYTENSKIIKNIDIFEKYKVFISKSAGDPNTDFKIIGEPYLGKPFEACTDSLIPVGKFETELEALNLQKYFKTKFLRYMVSILKVSQNVYQNVYQFVPLQDFTSTSDINWSKSIPEIDQQLYRKYGLTEEEIAFIESMIKPMS